MVYIYIIPKFLDLHFGEYFMKNSRYRCMKTSKKKKKKKKSEWKHVFIYIFMQIFMSFYERQLKKQMCYSNSFTLLINFWCAWLSIKDLGQS